MGSIVAAYASSHILFSPQAAPDLAQEIVNGMKSLGARAADAAPDVIVMITSDHMFNLNLSFDKPFCVAMRDDYMAMGDMGIPQRPFKGHGEFATGLIEHAAGKGFSLSPAEDFLPSGVALYPDHGVTLPLLFVRPWGRAAVVQIYSNVHVEPFPTPAQCLKLGGIIRDFVETKRPAGERVAVVASGGLSHWLNIPGMGTIAEDYDNECIEKIIAGRVEDFADGTASEIFDNSGNGGLELLNWITMASAVAGKKGERGYYVPMYPWQTGMAGIAMKV